MSTNNNYKGSSGVLILLIILFAITGFLSWKVFFNQSKWAYINIRATYESFELKKDLEKKYKVVINERKKITDSLYLDLKLTSNSLDGKPKKSQEDILLFTNKKETYLDHKKHFDEDNEALTKQYDEEILTQLNNYVKDFGNEKKYTLILGNDGNGAIMHAEESMNITAEVIEYINKRYSGKK